MEDYAAMKKMEEQEREKRLCKGDRIEKSWEMMKISKRYIKRTLGAEQRTERKRE